MRSLLLLCAAFNFACGYDAIDKRWTTTAIETGLPGGQPKLEVLFSPCSDHILYLEKGGKLTAKSTTAGQTGFIYDNSAKTYSYSDHGGTGLQFHPNFPKLPYVFMYYTAENNPPWNDACPRVIDGRSYCQTTAKLERLKLDVTVNAAGVCTSMALAGAPYVLFQGFCSCSLTHGNGDIKFYGQDLLLTSGDMSQAGGADYGLPGSDTCYKAAQKLPQGKLRSQRTDFYNGKVWKILGPSLFKTTGQLVPYTDMKLVAKGFRQPYAMAVNQDLGIVVVGDVGSKLKEKIVMLTKNDLVNPAALNFGWPCLQGSQWVTEVAEQNWLQTICDPAVDYNCNLCKDVYPCAKNPAGVGGCTAKWRPPSFEYRGVVLDPAHPKQCTAANSAIAGLAFFNGNQFGTAGAWLPKNTLVASDYGTGCMWYFKVKADGTPDWKAGAKLLMVNHYNALLTRGKDGHLYSALLTDLSTIYKHGVATGAEGPTAALALLTKNANGAFVACAGTCQVQQKGATVRLDASASTAGGSAIAKYKFSFGDGSAAVTQAGKTIDHSYTTAGTRTVSVTVIDGKGLTGTAVRTLLVGADISITMVPHTKKWKLGDTIKYTLTAPGITGGQVTWDSYIYHCYANKCSGKNDCHTHTNGVDPGSETGLVGYLTPPEHYLPSHMELMATIKPTTGTAYSVSFATECLVYTATLKTSIKGVATAGWAVTNNEADACASPCTGSFMALSTATVFTNKYQSKGGTVYQIAGWKATKAAGTTVVANGVPQTNVKITENAMSITADYVPALPAKVTGNPPVIAKLGGFYKALEVVWSIPAGATYDWVIISVNVTGGGADYSTMAPVTGPKSATVLIPPTSTSYDVMLAGFNSATKKLTQFGPIRKITSSGDPALLCYQPLA